MKKIKLTLVFCMLTISNLIFASIVHVPNVNATVAYSTGGGFPTPITLTVDATDIDFTYSDFAGINAQNFNSPTGNIFTVTPAGTYSDELKLYQFNDPINGSNFLNIDGATGYGPMHLLNIIHALPVEWVLITIQSQMGMGWFMKQKV